MPILKKTGTKLPIKKPSVSKPKNVTNKAPLKKAAAPAKAPTPKVVRNEFGIAADSDQARVLAKMIEGGVDKHEVIVRCDEMFAGEVTSGGKPKPSSTIMNQLIRSLSARGFTVVSEWKFIPPVGGLTPAPRKLRASAPKTGDTKASPKKALGKLPVKKPVSAEKALAEKAGVVKPQAAPKKSAGKLPVKRTKASS